MTPATRQVLRNIADVFPGTRLWKDGRWVRVVVKQA